MLENERIATAELLFNPGDVQVSRGRGRDAGGERCARLLRGLCCNVVATGGSSRRLNFATRLFREVRSSPPLSTRCGSCSADPRYARGAAALVLSAEQDVGTVTRAEYEEQATCYAAAAAGRMVGASWARVRATESGGRRMARQYSCEATLSKHTKIARQCSQVGDHPNSNSKSL